MVDTKHMRQCTHLADFKDLQKSPQEYQDHEPTRLELAGDNTHDTQVLGLQAQDHIA